MNNNIIELSKETVKTLGFIPVDVKIITGKGSKTLKVVIYNKQKDISSDDCALVSNVLLRRIEIDYPDFSDNFDLIVESPGVDRTLRKIDDYIIFQGKEIRVVIKNPKKYGLNDNVIIGFINNVENNKIIVKINENELLIDINDISKANLYFDINKYL